MMPIERQVVSIELAKRLKELGVKQESTFWWAKIKRDEIALWDDETKSISHDLDEQAICSAFTVAELGQILVDYDFGFVGGRNKPGIGTPDFWCCDQKADSEANARAKFLISLIEQKLVKP